MLQKDFKYLGSHSEKYQLSVVLMADSFFYGIFDHDGKLISHRSYADIMYSDESVNTLFDDKELCNHYEKVHIVNFAGNSHQLAWPDNDFISSLPLLAWKELFKEQLPGQNIYNYFGITPAQKNLLDQLFKSNKYQVHDFLFLLTTYYIGVDSPCVHVHFEDHLVSIFTQNEGKVQFYNTFRFTSDKDVLYFVMAALNYSQLDPKNSKVNVSGWIDQKSSIFTLLESYIHDVKILKDSEFCVINNEDLQAANYFIHFINRICGS